MMVFTKENQVVIKFLGNQTSWSKAVSFKVPYKGVKFLKILLFS